MGVREPVAGGGLAAFHGGDVEHRGVEVNGHSHEKLDVTAVRLREFIAVGHVVHLLHIRLETAEHVLQPLLPVIVAVPGAVRNHGIVPFSQNDGLALEGV